ncbi:tRNA 5'-guanylyltransferase [bacterium]|nr:MAG: tRNA 5'-guanylyltransferase [bacterium]
MKPDDFERKMRQGEMYHSLRLPPNNWTVIRADGRSFSRFTESRFEKPFDPRFRDMMLAAARALAGELNAIYAYTESDEISLLMPRGWDLFDREVEKIVSVSAGVASAAFSVAAGEPAHFDARVWVGGTDDDVVDYFLWRQSDATRCCLNGWVYWTLRNEGASVQEATQAMERRSVGWKNEALFERGINFNNVPLWQRRGIGLRWEEYQVEGMNPVTGESVPATRRWLMEDGDLPMREAYGLYLRKLLG